LADIDPCMTLLDYLRLEEGLTGTKEGCNEGDCGACTVVRARLCDGALRYEAINSCILLIGALHGCQIITVEHLAGSDGALHPVQQALVDFHGSQCGFCTPGFVMSIYAASRQGCAANIDDTLAGNLCRCTGYAPIVRAAERVLSNPPEGPDVAALEILQSYAHDETVSLGGFHAPATLDDLATLIEAHPDAVILAGATDVGLWVTKQMRRLATVIYVGRVAELARIHQGPDGMEIGAGVSYGDAMAAIAAPYPDFAEIIRRIGSVQIRNQGTIGGNVANGSPIGDALPCLIAAGATLHLRRGPGQHESARRSLAVEDFFIDYGKQDLAPGEFVESITLPYPEDGAWFRAYKVSKRFDQDISAVLGAFNLVHENGVIARARIAFGGMAAIPKRATAVEAALIGAPWSEATVARAMAAMSEDFAPIDDLRASAAYRLRVAKNLLMRLYIETTEPAQETRLVGA
jgi:xanthine dehydrogenase small subunit